MHIKYKKSTPRVIILITLTLLALAVYYPGLSGPFLFDDHGNITENSLLRLSSLDLEELKLSALSGQAGPLKRPVAMLSFAINYYFSGGYNTFTFKTTNVLIHSACAYIVFLFCLQVFQRANFLSPSSNTNGYKPLAFIIAIIWLVHPINLTSVLYIVQRMTSLSTLFTLATLTLYVAGRNLQASLPTSILKICIHFSTSFICFILAIFSKENALLIPLYIAIIELTLFSDQLPYQTIRHIFIRNKKLALPFLVATVLIILIYSINYALPGYGSRHFTLLERALTETRVVAFYLFLILIPRIDAFGLFHDDIQLSTSVTSPWTTIPSALLIITLIALALYYKKQKPIFSLGVLLFFSGHLLESTIFPLQIAHEHRNHFPSIGLIIALSGLYYHSTLNIKQITATITVLSVLLTLSALTTLRSFEWKDQYSIAVYESFHHPNSPATLTMLSSAAYKKGKPDIALKAIMKAEKLAPFETAHSISHAILLSLEHQTIPVKLQKTILYKLGKNTLTPSTEMTISHVSKYIHRDSYSRLVPFYITWLQNLVIKLNEGPKSSAYYYFLAKGYIANNQISEGLNAYQRSHELDPLYINPLIEMGNIFLTLKQTENARFILKTIISKSRNLKRNYDNEIKELSKLIIQIEQHK